jgi:hypothetical protein
VAVRAALGTSADVHVLDPRDPDGPDGPDLRDGLGAVLRFADHEVTWPS